MWTMNYKFIQKKKILKIRANRWQFEGRDYKLSFILALLER